MKKLFTALFALCAVSLWSEDLSGALYRSMDGLSRAYQDAHPGQGMKAGLAILDIEDNSDLARKNRLGKTIEAYLRETVNRSMIYELVDRRHLESVLQEMELSLSGLVDGGDAPALALTGIRAFLWGDVTERGDRFVVSLGVTDAGTGTVLATESFEIERRKLVKISEDLQYSYVAPNGIGLSLGTFAAPSLASMPSDIYTKAPLILLDAGLAYRLNRYFMVSGGFLGAPTMTGEHYRSDDDISVQSVQPALATSPDPWGLSGPRDDIAFSQWTAQFNASFLRLDAQYTLNFSPKFNIGIAAGVFSALSNVRMYVQIGGDNSGLYYRQQLAGNDASYQADAYYQMPFVDTTSVEYLFMEQFLPGVRAELRPELFITPRLALDARAGYLWMKPLQVREVHAARASWWYYQDGKDPATWSPDPGYDPAQQGAEDLYRGEERASWIYYGWNPLLRPDGKRWTYDISGFYLYLGLSVFF